MIDIALCLLQLLTDGLPLLVYRYMLALLHNLISNVGSKVVLSEDQKRTDFIDRLLDEVELLSWQI
jgi:hypothetical protein